jgi:protein translocase SecG subunit
MRSLISLAYILVCLTLIILVLLQYNKGSQIGSGSASVSRSFFGASGSKGFLYTLTKWAVALFFILAFAHMLFDSYQMRAFEAVTSSILPLDQLP